MQDILMRLSIVLAIGGVICRLIPEEQAVAIAVSRSLHIGIPLRLLMPAVLLTVAGASSGIALLMAVFRLTTPLRN